MEVVNDARNARITICKHVFCTNCIEMVVQTQHKCPLCRTTLQSIEKALVGPAAEKEEDEVNLNDMGESSSKLDRLLQILSSTPPFCCGNGRHT
jgi:SWI/SNF-related matrix-associated actin-dependent regulator of chromatin subfamily A3